MIKKYTASLFILVMLFASCTTSNPNYGYNQPVYLAPGVGLGTIIAVVIS